MTLEELKKLCEEATPGPWFVSKGEYGVTGIGTSGEFYEHQGEMHPECVFDAAFANLGAKPIDMAFIAAARSALPLLIKVADAAKSLVYVIDKMGYANLEISVNGEPAARCDILGEMRPALAALEAET